MTPVSRGFGFRVMVESTASAPASVDCGSSLGAITGPSDQHSTGLAELRPDGLPPDCLGALYCGPLALCFYLYNSFIKPFTLNYEPLMKACQANYNPIHVNIWAKVSVPAQLTA